LNSAENSTIGTTLRLFGHFCKINSTYLSELIDSLSPQQKWNAVVKACLTAGQEILGKKKSKKHHQDKKLEELSKEKHKLKLEIDNCNNPTKRIEKQTKRRELKKQINNILIKLEESKIDEKLQEIEKRKDDSNKYYQALQDMQNRTPK